MRENHQVEWKSSWSDDYLRWICGFANAEGGVLVIGRNDRGVPVGVSNARKLLEDLPNKIRDVLGIMVDVRLVREVGKELVEIRVEPYPSPISYKGEYHYRSGSTKQELKGAALERFLLKKRGRHWDDAPEPSFTPRSCSAAALRLFKRRATESGRMDRSVLRDSREVVLNNLELTERHGLRRAACLLFSDRPEQYVSGAWIKIGFFVTDDDLRYQDEIHGNLFEQVEKTVDLLQTKYLKAYISYQGLQRRETFLFPEAALREALLNAVVHKDYSSGIPIQISVYDDRIVFWNPGDLPDNWTLERLLGKHPSCPFNPLLANAFFRAGYIESWGRGIEKIQRECREHGIAPPVYDFGMAGLMLTFRANPAHLAEAAPDQGSTTPMTTPITGEVERLVLVIEGQMSRAQIQQALKIRHEDHFRERYLTPALHDGIVEMTLPDRPKSRLQQYRLTPQGQVERARLQTPSLSEHVIPAGPTPPVTGEVTGEVTGGLTVETPKMSVKPRRKREKMSVETVRMTVETPVKKGGAPVEMLARVLKLLRANPQRTLADVAEEIGRSIRTVERATTKLVSEGRLRYVGPRKGGHWETLE